MRSSIQATRSQLNIKTKRHYEERIEADNVCDIESYLLETVSPLLHRSTSLLWVCMQTPWLLLAISKAAEKKSIDVLDSVTKWESFSGGAAVQIPVQG